MLACPLQLRLADAAARPSEPVAVNATAEKEASEQQLQALKVQLQQLQDEAAAGKEALLNAQQAAESITVKASQAAVNATAKNEGLEQQAG